MLTALIGTHVRPLVLSVTGAQAHLDVMYFGRFRTILPTRSMFLNILSKYYYIRLEYEIRLNF